MTKKSFQTGTSKITEYEYMIQKLQEMGQVGIWRYDFQNNHIVWTREMMQIFDASSMKGFCYNDFMDAVYVDDRDYVMQHWEAELPTDKFDINHRITVDDQLKWIRHRVDLDYDVNGQLESVIGFVQDITDFKFLEEKAIRAAQLAAVGEFTTMIAHEVNNPLSGIINYAQVFKSKACHECERVELMDRIMLEGERVSKVVSNLLAFSYSSNGEKGAQKLRNIFLNVLGLMEPKFDSNQIYVETSLEDNLPDIFCNAQQIEQVLLNILRNANHALSRGLLEGESRKVIRIEANVISINQKTYVELRISNNGPNIPINIIARIKTPFYTTKPAGIGTGLGLSISGDILSDHNGFFEIKSEPGSFTEMIISLPIVPE